MKAFGFLSFGHYAFGGQRGPSAEKIAKIHLEIAQAADEIGVNNASFRVHHFVPQASVPMPLLGAVAATTQRIEVGTGVIDMRYENPLYLAEEAASLYQLSGGRVALGVSRGAPEVAERGWEAFGYKGEAPNGADVARSHLEAFMAAVDGSHERLEVAARHVRAVGCFALVAEGFPAALGDLGGAARDAQGHAAAGELVQGGGFLREVEGVFVPHIDHAGAHLDALCRGGDGTEQRHRDGGLRDEVVNAERGVVHADLIRGLRNLQVDLGDFLCRRAALAAEGVVAEA